MWDYIICCMFIVCDVYIFGSVLYTGMIVCFYLRLGLLLCINVVVGQLAMDGNPVFSRYSAGFLNSLIIENLLFVSLVVV